MRQRSDEVLTIDELSVYLKIPKSTLYKLVREGKVPCQKIGRHWRFRKEAIDRWLEDRSSAPNSARQCRYQDDATVTAVVLDAHQVLLNREGRARREAKTEEASNGRGPGE